MRNMIKTRECKWCDKEFETKIITKIFCSDKCQRTMAKKWEVFKRQEYMLKLKNEKSRIQKEDLLGDNNQKENN
jgi:ribosomal protein L37AE/L43A